LFQNYYANSVASQESDNKRHSDEEGEDYIQHYQNFEEAPLEPPESPKHTYDFEKDSSESSEEEVEREAPLSPAKMADSLVDGIGIESLTTQEVQC